MQYLKDLAELAKRHTIKASDFLNRDTADSHPHTKPQIFYQKLLAGDFQSDKEAASFFFNDANTKNTSYKKLKSTVRDKLVKSLFFLEPKGYSSAHEKAYMYCCRYLSAAKIVSTLGSRNLAANLFQKVLNRAISYEMPEFIIESSSMLRILEGAMKGSIIKFDHYDTILKKYQKIYELNILAQGYYYRLVLPYIHAKANQEEIVDQANEYYKELSPYLTAYDSPILHLYTYLIQITAHLSIYDYTKAIDVCDRGVTFFESKKHQLNMPLRLLLFQQLTCYVQLRYFTEGEKTANRIIELVRKGTYNWFLIKEMHLMLALHSKKYQQAYFILNAIIKHPKFTNIYSQVQERILIYQGYIQFLIAINKIQEEGAMKLKKVRLGKLINSVPIFSKDKRGMNIPILILQILFMIARKDYGLSIDRFEAIQKYCSKYLRNDNNLRSNCFIRMLLLISKCYFHKKLIERKAEKYYNKLLETPLDVAQQGHEIEIIPYEDLWEMLLLLLENKHYKIRSS